jgi:ATP-dependent exoDNAse (exonuclease V) beta subunit
LLLHRHAGGRFDHALVRADAAGPVPDALRALHELAELRRQVTLPVLVRAVLDRTRLVEFAMLQPQGEQTAANLLKVIDQARTFAEASGRGLRGFVRWLKDNMTRQTDETDAPISEETDDVVRIVTIHASKGLEFPVVVFANMATKRRDYTTVLADRAAGRLHVKLGAKEHGFRTPGYDEAEAAELPHALAEERRLLYVAATRAKDRLVVSLVDRSDGDAPPRDDDVKSLADVLRTAGAHLGSRVAIEELQVPVGEAPLWKRPLAPVSAVDAARVVRERADWIDDHYALVARASVPFAAHTASSLKPDWETSSPFDDDAARRGRAADFGTAVHALLERSLFRDERVGALSEAVALEYGLAARAAEMAGVARRALASHAVKRALTSRRLLPETPFTVRLSRGGLAEGRIDLLFEEGGGLVIVDFKTDAVTAKDVDARAAVYRTQALVYAWAAQAAARMPVREVIFLFARPDPPLERALSVDDAFLAEAESVLEHGEPVPARPP